MFEFAEYLQKKSESELAEHNASIDRANQREAVANGLYDAALSFIKSNRIQVQAGRSGDVVRFDAFDETSLKIKVEDDLLFAVRTGTADLRDGRGKQPTYAAPVTEPEITAHIAEWLSKYMG